MIKRIAEKNVLADFNKKKVIVLLGPRQVGKTTLLDTMQDLREEKKVEYLELIFS